MPSDVNFSKDQFLRSDRTFHELLSDPKAKIVQVERLIESMDASGIDVSVCAGFGWTDPELAVLSNDYNLQIANEHPDRLIPLCSVNPLWGQQAVDEIGRCVELGAKGVGELHPNTQGILDADLASLAPVLDLTRNLDIPVLVHASEPVGHGYPGKGTVTPELLMALVNAYPNNKFVFSHFGGGLPFYGLMPEVGAALKNVYFDSAAFPFLYRSEVFEISAKAVGFEKILFASDYPVVSQKRAVAEFAEADLSNEYRPAIAGGNAQSLFTVRP